MLLGKELRRDASPGTIGMIDAPRQERPSVTDMIPAQGAHPESAIMHVIARNARQLWMRSTHLSFDTPRT